MHKSCQLKVHHNHVAILFLLNAPNDTVVRAILQE